MFFNHSEPWAHMQRLLIFCHNYPYLIIQTNSTSSSAILCSILKSPWDDIIKVKVWWMMTGISDRNTIQLSQQHSFIYCSAPHFTTTVYFEKRDNDGFTADTLCFLVQEGDEDSSNWALTNCSAKCLYKSLFSGYARVLKKTNKKKPTL